MEIVDYMHLAKADLFTVDNTKESNGTTEASPVTVSSILQQSKQ